MKWIWSLQVFLHIESIFESLHKNVSEAAEVIDTG